jgi:hypothetical protein
LSSSSWEGGVGDSIDFAFASNVVATAFQIRGSTLSDGTYELQAQVGMAFNTIHTVDNAKIVNGVYTGLISPETPSNTLRLLVTSATGTISLSYLRFVGESLS